MAMKKQRQKHAEALRLRGDSTSIANACSNLSLPKKVDATVFEAEKIAFDAAFQSVLDLETRLGEARATLQLKSHAMRKLIKRVHAAVLSIYGDDSPEIETVGVKRISKRKRRARKPHALAAA